MYCKGAICFACKLKLSWVRLDTSEFFPGKENSSGPCRNRRNHSSAALINSHNIPAAETSEFAHVHAKRQMGEHISEGINETSGGVNAAEHDRSTFKGSTATATECVVSGLRVVSHGELHHCIVRSSSGVNKQMWIRTRDCYTEERQPSVRRKLRIRYNDLQYVAKLCFAL